MTIEEQLSALPVYESELTEDEKKEVLVTMRKQLKYLIEDRSTWIKIFCAECGKRAVYWMMFRCLYCGLYYCKTCAQVHFGARLPNEYVELEEEHDN